MIAGNLKQNKQTSEQNTAKEVLSKIREYIQCLEYGVLPYETASVVPYEADVIFESAQELVKPVKDIKSFLEEFNKNAGNTEKQILKVVLGDNTVSKDEIEQRIQMDMYNKMCKVTDHSKEKKIAEDLITEVRQFKKYLENSVCDVASFVPDMADETFTSISFAVRRIVDDKNFNTILDEYYKLCKDENEKSILNVAIEKEKIIAKIQMEMLNKIYPSSKPQNEKQ